MKFRPTPDSCYACGEDEQRMFAMIKDVVFFCLDCIIEWGRSKEWKQLKTGETSTPFMDRYKRQLGLFIKRKVK